MLGAGWSEAGYAIQLLLPIVAILRDGHRGRKKILK